MSCNEVIYLDLIVLVLHVHASDVRAFHMSTVLCEDDCFAQKGQGIEKQ